MRVAMWACHVADMCAFCMSLWHRLVVEGFVEQLRGRLKDRLHPVIVDDAVIAAVFAESGSE